MSPAGCETCRLIDARDIGRAPLWDSIVRTAHWDVVHANSSTLLGWLCLVVRRHIESIADLTDAETEDLARLLRDTSRFLRDDTGCAKTYVMQFAEHPDHPHVHFHVVPRMDDLPAEHRGAGIFAYLTAGPDERVAESAMNAFAERLRAQLGSAASAGR